MRNRDEVDGPDDNKQQGWRKCHICHCLWSG
jgi:hypothetical protein